TTTPHPSSTRTLHTATTRPCQGGDKKGGVVVPPKALMVPPLILPPILNVECLWVGDRTSATSNHSNPPPPPTNPPPIPLLPPPTPPPPGRCTLLRLGPVKGETRRGVLSYPPKR